MTDLEMVRLCAEARGVKVEQHPIRGTIMRWWYMDGNIERCYDPLHDDAHAMALEDWLIERGTLSFTENHLHFTRRPRADLYTPILICEFNYHRNDMRVDRRRAIVECVAKARLVAQYSYTVNL